MKTLALICAHNGARYIYEQLSSIARQSVPVSRIVVFDFLSADDTAKIVQRFISEQERPDVQLVKKQFARGVCDSFVTALREIATSIDEEWLVYLCDQDDYWLPFKNEKILAVANQLELSGVPAYLIHHDVVVTDASLGELAPSFYDSRYKSLLATLDMQLSLSFSTVIGHTIALNFGLRQIANSLPLKDGMVMHDWMLSVLAELVGRRVFVPESLSLYRQHEKNVIGFRKSSGDRPATRVANVLTLSRRVAAQNLLIFRSLVQSTAIGRPYVEARAEGRGLLVSIYLRNLLVAPDVRRRVSALLIIAWHIWLTVCPEAA